MIYIVALGIGFKCPCKINLNTQCGGEGGFKRDKRSKQDWKGSQSYAARVTVSLNT